MAEKKWYCKTCLGLLARPAETAAGNQAQGYCSNCSNMMWGQEEPTRPPEPPTPEAEHERAVAALRMSGEPGPVPYFGEHHGTFERLNVGMQVTLPDMVALAAAVVLQKGQRVAVVSSEGIVGILVTVADAE